MPNPDYSDGFNPREPFPGASFFAFLSFAILLTAVMLIAGDREDRRETANDAAILDVREGR